MVLLWKVWTPTPDRCLKDLAQLLRRKGRAGWLFRHESPTDETELPLPPLQD